MISILRFVIAVLASAALAHAQNNGQNKPAPVNPEADWAALTALLKPASGTPVAQQQAQAKQAAQAARNFYSSYPSHAKAQEAQKLEVLSNLRAVSVANETQLATALARGQSFWRGNDHPDDDRLEVAIATEQLRLSALAWVRKENPQAAEREQVADRLLKEFGDKSALHCFYLSIAQTADRATAARIATKLLAGKANGQVKAEAQRLLDREALVGQPLNLAATTTDGKALNLGGQATLVFLFSASSGPNGVLPVARFCKTTPPGVRVAYVAMGAANQLPAVLPIRGQLAVVDSPAAVGALKIKRLPYVYAVNKQGQLVGYGPVDEWDRLAAAAQQ